MTRRMLVAGAAVALLALGATARAGVKEGIAAWQSGDYAAAVAQWQPAAAAGDADAQFNLGQAYKLGRGVPQDIGQAQAWYYKAAQQGHAGAEANYGLILFQNGDRNGAMPWLQKAAMQGEPRAQYVVGTALFNGDLAGKDWPRAYAYMTRAAAAGLPQAANSVAQMDQFIPLGDRQKGVKLARTLAQPMPEGSIAASGVTATPIGTPGIATSALPPSSARGDQLAAATPARPGKAPKPKRGRQAAAPAAGIAFTEPVAVPTANFGSDAVAEPAPPPPPPAMQPTPPVRTAAAPPAAPKPARHDAIPPAPSPGGRFRIQLGAFATPGAAETAWKSARGLSGLNHYGVKSGAVTRLQAGPFATRAAAERACQSAAGACFVTAAP